MKFNWKVLVACVVIVGTIFWAVDSVRTRSYSGASLNFSVGSGPVTMTNLSNAPVSVQLSAPKQSFSVSSQVDGINGAATRQGSGNVPYTLVFPIPMGSSEFTVLRGTAVTVAANATPNLEAIVQPLTDTEARFTLIVAVIVILGSLYFISRTTEHRWIAMLRGTTVSNQVAKLAAETATIEQKKERPLRAYGDNRSDISK